MHGKVIHSGILKTDSISTLQDFESLLVLERLTAVVLNMTVLILFAAVTSDGNGMLCLLSPCTYGLTRSKKSTALSQLQVVLSLVIETLMICSNWGS